MVSANVTLGDDETSWDLIYKRNKVERLKNEKFPYDVFDERPAERTPPPYRVEFPFPDETRLRRSPVHVLPHVPRRPSDRA